MEKETFEQIQTKNDAAIGALSTYLDQTVPKEQFSSIATVRAQNIKPIQYQEDLVSNGLIGEDGLITQKGILHNELKDKGFLSHDGTLTEKATAFVMDEDEALRPENLNYWRIRKGNKIGERDVPWGETFESIGERVWDAVAGLGTMTGIGLQYLNQRDPDDVVRSIKNLDIPFDEDKTRSLLQEEKDKLMNRASVAAVSMVENSAKSFTEAGAIVNLAGAWALALPSKLLGDHKNATELVDTARQFQDRLRKSNKDAAIGSTLDAVFQTVQYVPEMARAKSELPKEEFDKLVKQPGATGEIFVDPFGMAQVGTVMKLAMIPITSRVALNAERVLGKAAERVTRLSQIEVDLADLERARGLTQNSADIAKKTAEALRERYDLTGNQDLLRRANTAEDIFNGSSTKVAQFTNDGIRLSEEAAQLTAESQKLASRVPVVAAQKFEAAIKAGRDLKSVPFKTFASIIEPVGRGLVALDDGLDSISKKLGIGAAYNLLTSKVGQAVGYGSAFGLGPVPALVGAAGSVLKSGPFLQRLADTSRIMGTEMAKAQSQMPFFQRVANNPMISPAHRSLAHLSDLATLGGFAPYVAKKAVKGTALSFPLDFAAEYMSEGGEVTPNTFKQAFAESLLIGGSSAALGGMFAGTQKRHRELSNNDESNFRNEITSPEQKQLFTNAPKFLRNAVGTFSAVFPSVNIEFTQGGGGFHDDNTIGIDVNSSNPLKYLLAHEVKHLLVHRNQMHTPIVTMMLGDGETGGIMRAPDGSLNPEFDAFAKEYNSRQIASGREPVSLGKIAEEFFVEAGAEDMAGMAESGELGAIASRTEARRMVGRLFNAALDKSTILKDFHLRIGGLMDQGGKLVSGNGLLSSGITQTPEMRNMTRNMLSRAAGRAVGQFEPLGAANMGGKGEGPGINLPITPTDKAMIEKIGPVEFEMETVNGVRQVARDSSGNPIPIDFNTQLMRSRTGSLVQEAIGNRPSSYQYSTGEMNLNDEGVWEGYLSPDLIEQIKRKGVLNQEQIRIIENVNSMVKNFKGDVALVINHPATSRNRKGKLNYKTLKATLRQVAPVSWSITKDGNLMLGLMSVTQLKSNVDNRIASSTGQKLYQGNRAKLMVDVGRVMELHNKGQRTDSYFDEQYGAAKSQQYKNFVNSVFGLISKKQGEANPIFSEENLRSGNGVYKTYRADRISQATKMTGDKYPFQYDFVVQNMMPNGVPTLDDQGRPVAQSRLPEQAGQMPEYQGTMEQAKPSYLPEPKIESKKIHIITNKIGMQFPKSNPKSGYTEVKMETSDGNQMIYKFQAGSNAPPEVKSYTTKNKEWVAITQADRHDGVDARMGGVAYPFLESNNVSITASDGNAYRPVWASLGESTTSSMKSMAMQTTSGTFFVHLMGEEAHISNNQTFNDYFTILKKSKIPEEAKKNIAIVRELASRKTEIELNNTALYNKSRTSKTPIDETKLQKIDPDISRFFKELGSVKSSKTRGNEAKAKEQFNAALDKLKKKEWFSEFESSLSTKKYADRSARDTFHVRGAQIDALYSIPDVPSVKKYLSDSSDFIGGKTGDIVAAVQVSKNPEAFRIYTGDDPIQESKMKPLEKEIRDKLLASGKFKSHVSYPWVVLGPANGDNFMLDKAVSAETLLPNYKNEHPSETVKNGNSTTILGAMRMKLGVPMIVGGETK